MNIETLKNSLSRKFRGASLDDVQGIENYSVFDEAASNMLSRLDPYETVRYHRFNQFSGVYYYAAPEDLKSKKVIDPRPQEGRRHRSFSQEFTKDFNQDKEYDLGHVSVEFQDGVKVLGLSDSGKGSLRIDEVGTTTGWTAAGGAANLETDETIRLDSSDSLRFDLGATGGYIEKSTLEELNLEDHETLSSLFRKVYLPTTTGLTSMSLRIGSSSADYWTLPGVAHLGSYRRGVNLVRFDWEGAVATGTPDAGAIEYERLTFATTAAIADVRVGPMDSKLPTPYETPYYSNRIFRDEDGDWLESPEHDSDEIVLEKEAENIFFYECCVLIAEDLSMDDEAGKFRKKLGIDDMGDMTGAGLYGNYKEDKPTEKLRPHTRYIKLHDRRARRGIRRR